MKPASQEVLYASLQRGMQAKAELGVVIPTLKARQDSLILQAVLDYNAKKLDGQGALLFVASLVEIQRLIDDLEAAGRKGDRAAKQLTEEN